MLSRLMLIVRKAWVFDENEYPALATLKEDDRWRFALVHTFMHFAKTVGYISSALEPADHRGGSVYASLLQKAIIKAFVDVLQLANVCGMTHGDLIRGIEEWAKDPKHF